jgi:8-oxo-dGTP pyrophosphatase MutT (NUDIX family)
MSYVVNAAIIREDDGENKVLLVKKRDVWILPGGKLEDAEDNLKCLDREIGVEELPGTVLSNFDFFGEFYGITPHSGRWAKAKVYLADADNIGEPSAEISDSKWFSRKDRRDYEISDITGHILDNLYVKRLIS